ncbi:unnamed protein product [Rhizophagus irregularis]|uniref:Uncharacterized protein n=1 Tax=Rhizophagus irregularis TaxID=588596 RepID=A0A915Z9H8_9GLOM|nr:unnamed protein product [Rhizophagus irregularis]CAB5129575.1 unnamed protein product [Rhizophagus irregularis]CAB5366269.1 unnamed protein product [Rhizophagus irregularis]
MENFASNINKPDFHNYDDVSFMEEEYDFDFKNINAFQSARYFSTITDNIDDYILELDSNFDDESTILMVKFVPVEVHKIYVVYKNIFGTWEIDSEVVRKVNDFASLGVCYSHQMYDQTKLHAKNAKGTKNSSLGFISNRKCLFCNINKTFYTRGKQCDQHSWTLVGRDLQVPCEPP